MNLGVRLRVRYWRGGGALGSRWIVRMRGCRGRRRLRRLLASSAWRGLRLRLGRGGGYRLVASTGEV
jgi:hypothetical protein